MFRFGSYFRWKHRKPKSNRALAIYCTLMPDRIWSNPSHTTRASDMPAKSFQDPDIDVIGQCGTIGLSASSCFTFVYQSFGCWWTCTGPQFMALCRSWYAKTPEDSLECIAVKRTWPNRNIWKHIETMKRWHGMAWHGTAWRHGRKQTEVAKVLNSQVMWHFGRMKPATVAVVLWAQTEGRSLAIGVQSPGVTSCDPRDKGNIAKESHPNERQLDSIPWNCPCCAAQFCTQPLLDCRNSITTDLHLGSKNIQMVTKQKKHIF
jgi:hypothetical protein